MSQISQELLIAESLILVNIFRTNDCIKELRLRLIALIHLLLSMFLPFPMLHVNIENLCLPFLRWYWTRILKLGIHVFIWMMSCGVV